MASQTIVGPTPAGGAKAVILFKDENNRPCERKDATQADVQEQDEEGNVLAHHTVDLKEEKTTSLPPETAPEEGDDDDPAEKGALIAEIMAGVLDDDTLTRMADGEFDDEEEGVAR